MRKNSQWFIYHILFLFFILLIGQNCQTKPRAVSMAFYHWKTMVDTSDFKNIKNEKIYVRLFDVDWDDGQFRARAADRAESRVEQAGDVRLGSSDAVAARFTYLGRM